ncbi:MAG: hypothetical protein GX989_02405 [Firmicutes bacterium]|nr:hypothetical protein [Bacillota bacterium]
MRRSEQKLYERLAHRGYSLEDCQKLLANRHGDVIIINRRSKRQTDLKDFASINNC